MSVPAAASSALVEALELQHAAWEARPLVRELYGDWHRMATGRLSPVAGPTLELGCGFGAFKEHAPATVATDVEPTPWAERVMDAERLDVPSGSVANLVMFDVLHHLPRPGRFFAEAERVLVDGGRIVMVEPYCSAVSYPAYRWLHFEGADMRVDPFADGDLSGPDPLDANNALATLVFWRHREAFTRRHPRLAIVDRERFAPVLYPLSGGLTGRRMAPRAAARPLRALERAIRPLWGLLAFRCLVVLESTEA